MTQLQFTLNLEEMENAILQSDLTGVVKSSIILLLNEYMEHERDHYIQADAYERNEERKAYRNGYYERDYLISLGKITLKVPRTRDGQFTPTIFERYQRMDQAFILSMMEMVINGVSTRKVTQVVEQLAGESVSASLVSKLMKKLDPIVKEWANRPLETLQYTHLYVDAMYIKVREKRRVVSKGVYIAMALSELGSFEVLGFAIQEVESYQAWSCFLKSLKARGLNQPNLIISDAHEGLKKAIKEVFLGTSWQRCTVHFKRNIFSSLPKKDSAPFKRKVREVFDQPTEKEAREKLQEVMDLYHANPRYEKALNVLEEGFEDAIQFLNSPENLHRFIKSTNHLERLNQEVRRRERVIRIFPNHQSAFRLIGAVLMQIDDEERKKKRSIKPKK